MSGRQEQLKFYKGLESKLPTGNAIEVGALYHCLDTNNTYLGVFEPLMEIKTNVGTTSTINLVFKLAAAAGTLTPNSIYIVSNTYYYTLSGSNYVTATKITGSVEAAKGNASALSQNTYYYFIDEKSVYKTADLLPGYELYSSASGKRQLGGGTTYDAGDAKGLFSFAGGSSDASLASAIIGYDLTDDGFIGGIIDDQLGNAEKRLKNKLGTPPTASGEVSLSYGSANDSISAVSTTIGVGSTAGSKGFYIHSITLNGNLIELSLSKEQSSTFTLSTSGTTVSLTSNDDKKWDNDCKNQLEKIKNNLSILGKASIILKKPFVEIGEISSSDFSFENGTLKIDNSDRRISATNLEDAAGSNTYTIPYQFSFSVPTAAEVGIADIHFAGLATGLGNSAAGTLSQAHGKTNTAAGQFSFVTGQDNVTGYGAFASGQSNRALGINSHAEGTDNDTRGSAAHAEGSHTYAYGDYSHAEGNSVINFDPSEIGQLNAENIYTNWSEKDTENKVERYSVAYGNWSHVEGQNSLALGSRSHAEGWMNAAIGSATHAEGRESIARGDHSHAEGGYTRANGYQSHAEGGNSVADGSRAHAEGYDTNASGNYSHSEGYDTNANGVGTHAEGGFTQAIGDYSHAEGRNAIAYGKEAHAEGESSKKCSNDLLLDGNEANIFNNWNGISNPADKYSVAYGNYSHVEGQNNLALGGRSHAEGWMTIASGVGSHSAGRETQAGYIKGSTYDLGIQSVNVNKYYQCMPGTLTIKGTGDWCDFVSSGQYALAFFDINKAQLSDSFYFETKNNQVTKTAGDEYSGPITYYRGDIEESITAPSNTAFLRFLDNEPIDITLTEATVITSTTASNNSTTYGLKTKAFGHNSFAEGNGTIASSHNQHVQGSYNVEDKNGKYAHIVGGGSSSKRKNIYTLDWEGNGEYAGKLNVKKGITATETISSSTDVKVNNVSLKTTASTANEAKAKAEDNASSISSLKTSYDNQFEDINEDIEALDTLANWNKSRLDTWDKNMTGVYPLGTYYNGNDTTSGYLIKLGPGDLNAYVVLKITGFSGGNGAAGYIPIDSTYQFYCYPAYNDKAGIITKCSAIALGHDLGDLTVYRYDNNFYAHLPVSQTYLTLNFEIVSDKTLAPTVALKSAHTKKELMVVIAPKYKLRNGTGTNSELFNNATIAAGENSHAEGNNTAALGSNSHAEGNGGDVITVQVSGDAKATKYTLKTANTSTKVGQIVKNGNTYATITARTDTQITTNTTLSSSKLTDREITIYPLSASGNNSHAEGYQTIASGAGSHAEGGHGTTASGSQSHAEGYNTSAKSQGSHAEGKVTTASGEASHAEGKETTASGEASHAEGYLTQANGNYSHAEGCGTITHAPAQHVQGKYNKGDSNKAFIIGGGSSDSDRKNIMTVDWNGNISSNNYRGQNTYNLGSYYGLGATPQGYLFDLGSSDGSLMVVFKITGHSYYAKGGQPFDTTFQFYAWDPKYQSDGTPFHTAYSGVTLGADVGDFTAFYVNEGTAETPAYHLYMYLNETGMYQTYNFELITNTALSNRVTVERTNVLPEGIPAEDSPYRIKITPTRATAAALTTDAGSKTKPVYFANGVPVECDYTIEKSVPSNAIFTDTTYDKATTTKDGLLSKEDKAKLDGIANGAEVNVQSDWNVTDKNSDAYIKNKPSFSTGGGVSAVITNDSSNQASGSYAHAEGHATIASGESSHAANYLTRAYGDFSHAEGWRTVALGAKSHAEGSSPCPFDDDEYSWQLDPNKGTDVTQYTAKQIFDIWDARPANKKFTMAIGNWSHAETQGNLSIGTRSHAEGWNTAACSVGAHTEGIGTISAWATSVDPWDKSVNAQHVEGSYNTIMNEDYLHIVGNGASDSERSNAHTLDKYGNAWYAGTVYIGGTGPEDANKKKVLTTADRYSLTIKVNGTSKVQFNGSAAKSIDLTPSLIGAVPLNSSNKIDSTYLPSYVDDVIEVNGISTASAGVSGKIYVDTTNNKTYRWSGSAYVEISSSLALGETSSTAYAGDKGKTAAQNALNALQDAAAAMEVAQAAKDHADAKGQAYDSGLYKITTNSEGHVTGATAVEKADITKLGIPGADTTYKTATKDTLGLVKIGYNTTNKNYAVQLDSDGKMYVNVPWTDTDTNTWRGIQNNLTSDSVTDSLSAKQGKELKALIDGVSEDSAGYHNLAMSAITSVSNSIPTIKNLTVQVDGNNSIVYDVTSAKTINLKSGNNILLDVSGNDITIDAYVYPGITAQEDSLNGGMMIGVGNYNMETDTVDEPTNYINIPMVSSSHGGLMYSDDKKKLDGITYGSTLPTSAKEGDIFFKII